MLWIRCCGRGVAVVVASLALLFIAGGTKAASKRGDIHSQFDESFNSIDQKPVGGCARIAHVIELARRNYREGKGPPVLYFDTGDVFVGSPWFSVHKHKIVTAFMNALKPDAVCLGNSEFSYGIRELTPYVTNAEFPIIISNLGDSKNEEFDKMIKRKHIITVEDKKVGILGYVKTLKQTFGSVLAASDILDEIETINSAAKSLRNEGVDLVIVLGHGGLTSDITLGKMGKDIDIIIGGSSHTFMWTGKPPDKEIPVCEYPKMVRRLDGAHIPIVHAYKSAKYLGKFSVSLLSRYRVKCHTFQPIFLSSDIEQDENILNLLESFRSGVSEANTTFVGKSRVLLDGESCRFKECNFGNLVADSFVRYNARRYLTKYFMPPENQWTDASIGLINAGSFKNDINAKKRKNNVYKLDILTALPFQNLLYVILLPGSDLLLSLEHGAKGNDYRRKGEYLIASGLKIVYDFAKPEGARVVSVLVKCAKCRNPKYENLKKDEFYGIVTTEYLVNSGDGHLALGKGKSGFLFPLNMTTDVDTLMEYFETFQIIAPEVDGRVVFKNPFKSDSSSKYVSFSQCVPVVLTEYLFYLLLISDFTG